jgi:hypothetical protein
MGELLDAPNQQVVRADGSAPWHEGTGGEPAAEAEAETGGDDLDAMTKNELLAYAEQHDISPANAGMTKEELRAAINEAG